MNDLQAPASIETSKSARALRGAQAVIAQYIQDLTQPYAQADGDASADVR
jgi:hypothetical protein